MSRTLACLLLCALPSLGFAGVAAAGTVEPLPGDSLYQLDARLTDQSGEDFALADLDGQPVLVSMFYTSCRYVCPLIIDSARGVERSLSSTEAAQLQVLLVSMDPARDTPEALNAIFERRKLDPANWRFARSEADDVRRLAAVLGIRYRALPDGEFNHSSDLVLLDHRGRKLASTPASGGAPDATFLEAVNAALAAASTH
jgi:protein SCO1/2